ncbi:MAG: hypothetical protein ACRYGI_10960 [Janthinobacterium lividum]
MAGQSGPAMISSTSLGAFNVSPAGTARPAAAPARMIAEPAAASTRAIATPAATMTTAMQNRPRGSLLDISA